MANGPRKLRVEFSSQDEFLREYNINLANGGIFVSTMDVFDIHEAVRVELDLAYCEESVTLAGEVVHCILPALSGAGAKPGVAIQLSTPASELRSTLEPLAGKDGSDDEEIRGSGQRRSVRADATAPVTLRCEDGSEVEGRTRNISNSGMLVSVKGQPVPVGGRVEASLVHPKTGVQTNVDGTVVRHMKAQDGSVMALGIKFEAPPEAQREVADWVGEVRASEHSKKLGGISGSIAELGMNSLVHMFATSAPQGSLRLTRADEHGELLFDAGLVRGARLGDLRDGPALAALLEWSEGNFEFLAGADASQFGEVALPIDEAIHAATSEQAQDAAGRDEIPSYSLDAKLSVLGSVDMESLDKTEQAIIDLARVDMTLAKVIDIIPEPAEPIYRALQGLMEHGLVALKD